MLYTKYTATLNFKNNEIINSYGNDLKRLIINTLIYLECDKFYISGEIKDNSTGKIIHKCRRITSKNAQALQ